MSSENLPAIGDRSFEVLKQTNQHGAEFWSARDLQSLLGYNQWRSFENAITRAITSCEQSGNEPDHHFAHARKMIAVGKGGQREDNLMDRMDATELAANQFRMTQTREKLARDGIRGEQRAVQTHNDVGREVRAAIQRIGGTLPENVPPAEHIKQVQQRVQSTPTKLVLDDSDSRGLSQVPSESREEDGPEEATSDRIL